MTKRQLISLGVGLVVLLLGIFYQQITTGVIRIDPVLLPYVAGAVGFLLVTGIPSLWPHGPSDPPLPPAPTGGTYTSNNWPPNVTSSSGVQRFDPPRG